MPLRRNRPIDESIIDEPIAEPSPGTQAWSEEQLVTAAQQGSREALDELLARYRSMVFGILRRYTLNYDEAEDLVQEVMLSVCRNITRFRGQSRFSSWLAAIAINAAISSKRKTRRAQWIYLDEPGQSGGPPIAYLLADCGKTPEQSYMSNECVDLLKRRIRRLHPMYRNIFVRTCIDEVPIDTIAHTLGLTLPAVKSRLHRARRMLSVSFRPFVNKSHRVPGKIERRQEVQ